MIDNTGVFLYTLQYYRLTDVAVEKKAEEFWKAIMKLITTIDSIGEQRNKKQKKDIEESIIKKTQTYLTKNNKKIDDLFYTRNK